MTVHQGLPVPGYQPQSQQTVDLVAANKEMEERCLRQLDHLLAIGSTAGVTSIDLRWLAIGRTHLEQAWMAINRALMQPRRIRLQEDPE